MSNSQTLLIRIAINKTVTDFTRSDLVVRYFVITVHVDAVIAAKQGHTPSERPSYIDALVHPQHAKFHFVARFDCIRDTDVRYYVFSYQGDGLDGQSLSEGRISEAKQSRSDPGGLNERGRVSYHSTNIPTSPAPLGPRRILVQSDLSCVNPRLRH
jgi:hypothetical protein